ncbi:hypothetical protein [Dyella silvatica]|uniref:hypothetical protein n=1 Tax=Dyella silvatica TaxID=2992128 RepID=UPI00224CA79E|nr:hypothetical protein [Dyella silvatica]
MSKPKKLPPLNTPRGVAVFPALNVPDTKFKPEGEYTARLAFDPNAADVQALVTELERRRDLAWDEHLQTLDAGKRKQFEKVYSKAPVFTEEVDKEGDETGRITINFKMKASGTNKKTGKPWTQRPTILDARGAKMANPPDIFGGSVLRIGFETSDGPVPSAKKFYISCRLLAVKVLELVSRGGYSADALGLGDEEEGYEADESELSSTMQQSEAASDESDAADAGNDDF